MEATKNGTDALETGLALHLPRISHLPFCSWYLVALYSFIHSWSLASRQLISFSLRHFGHLYRNSIKPHCNGIH